MSLILSIFFLASDVIEPICGVRDVVVLEKGADVTLYSNFDTTVISGEHEFKLEADRDKTVFIEDYKGFEIEMECH